MKHTFDELRVMQSYPLSMKMSLTRARIREWYHEFGGNVYVSFSGGKDSQALLQIVRDMFPNVPAVFVDTGLEYPGIRDNVKRFDNVVWLKPKKNFKQVILEKGYPYPSKKLSAIISLAQHGGEAALKRCRGEYYTKNGTYSNYNMPKKYRYLVDSPYKFSDYCCDIMKKQPVKRYEHETGNVPFLGIMANESKMRELTWLKNGCNAFDIKRPQSMPLSFWTEQDILEYHYMKGNNIAAEYGEIKRDENGKYYTTGVSRTGCMFCMFGLANEKSPNRFEQMRVNYPKQYDYCMKSVSEGGLGMGELIDFLGLKR